MGKDVNSAQDVKGAKLQGEGHRGRAKKLEDLMLR